MVICFECDVETKKILDELLATGQYRDYSEAIRVAIGNQSLLQEKIGKHGSTVVETLTTPDQAREGQTRSPVSEPVRAELRKDLKFVVPSIFLMPDKAAVREFAPMPGNSVKHDLGVPVENWIFGQYNRLLPLKVSCRALANLATSKHPISDYEITARQIAAEAEKLGASLSNYDLQHSLSRDDRLSIAFPVPGPLSHKSRERYATQFVVNVNTSGQASSLLVDFKFVDFTRGKNPRLALTEPALYFSLLNNPILDQQQQDPLQKFSTKEKDFLIEHILSFIPKERAAYRTILGAISKGQNTPEKLAITLGAYVRKKDTYTPTFLAAQRSGAIARMADLALVIRLREGVRVTYEATPQGREFVKRAK